MLLDRARNLTSQQRTLISSLAGLGGSTSGRNLSGLFDLYRELREDQEVVGDLSGLFDDPGYTLCGDRGGGNSKLLRLFTQRQNSSRPRRDTHNSSK